MQNKCRFCQMFFHTDIAGYCTCIDCKKAILKEVIEDEKTKFEFLEEVLKDQTVIERLAKAVFNVPARNVGIGGEGTLSDFFRTRKRSNSTR